MTPKISFATAVAGAALTLGVPAAWGQSQPDVVERTVAARELSQRSGQVATYPDAFERAALAAGRAGAAVYPDAHQRSAPVGDRQGISAVSSYPDAFERAAFAGSAQRVLVDSHDRIVPTSTPASMPVSSGRDVEWPQVGIGVALGIFLALGLGMAMRLTRIRRLAH